MAPSSMAWRISESRERMARTTAVWLYCAVNACTAGIWSTRSTDGNRAATCGFRAWTTDGSPYSVNTNTHLQWAVELLASFHHFGELRRKYLIKRIEPVVWPYEYEQVYKSMELMHTLLENLKGT